MKHPILDDDLRQDKDIGLSIIKKERVPGGQLVIYDSLEEADTMDIINFVDVSRIVNGSEIPKIAGIANEVAARIILVDLNSENMSDSNYVLTSFDSFISIRGGESNKFYYAVSYPFMVKVAESLRRKNNPEARRETVKTYGAHLVGNIIEEFNRGKGRTGYFYPDAENGWNFSHFTNLILGKQEITDETFNEVYNASGVHFSSFIGDDKARKYIQERIETVHKRLKIK